MVSEQNGFAKRRRRMIRELGLTMLHHSVLPRKFWTHAFSTTAYLINRLPLSVLSNSSTFYLVYDKHPDYHCLRVFGCKCYPYVWDRKTSKFDPKSLPCVFLGYILRHTRDILASICPQVKNMCLDMLFLMNSLFLTKI